MDRETVITHLQIIHTWAEFARERDLQFFTPKHLEDIAEWSADALSLLKEQEAVKPKHKERMGGFVAGLCPTCGTALNNILNVKACGKCGQEVKWE